MKRFVTLLMALVMVLGLATTVFAADSTITYKGHANNKGVFEVVPGTYYTDTDLFTDCKGLMPGDSQKETIYIKNGYNGCDYIKISIRGLLHDATGNPLSAKVLAEIQADDRKGELSEIEYMHKFLDQLTLTVMQGSKLIYTGHPSSLDMGLAENVYLGSLDKGKTMKLDVTLEVPIEMGNEFADRIGEVDWVLVVSEFDYEDAKTGDETLILPYVILMAVAATGLAVMLIVKRRKKK